MTAKNGSNDEPSIKFNDIWVHISNSSYRYMGLYSKSTNGTYLVTWIDHANERDKGEFLLLENKRIILKGSLLRPQDGKVANNGTFVLNDWLLGFGKKPEGRFVAYDKRGRELISHTFSANLKNNGLSNDGGIAICQTLHSNSSDSDTVTCFDLAKGQLRWQITPQTKSADAFEFDLDNNVVYFVYNNIGKFKYSLTGRFLDDNLWQQARSQYGSGYELAELADAKLAEMDKQVSVDSAKVILDLYFRAIEKIDSSNFRAKMHRNMGEVYELLADIDQASKHYQEALKLDPKIGVLKKLQKMGFDQPLQEKRPPFSIRVFAQASIQFLETTNSVGAGVAPRGTYYQVDHYEDACWYVKNHYDDPELAHGRSTISITNKSGEFLESHPLDHLIYRIKRSPKANCFLALTFDLKLFRHDADFGQSTYREVGQGILDRYHAGCIDLSEDGEYFVFSNSSSLTYLDYRLRQIADWKIPDEFDRHQAAPSSEIQKAILVLELPKQPTDEQIKSAFRRMLLKVHPDINRDDPNASDKTRAVVEAYEVLTRGMAQESTNDHEFLRGPIRISMPTFGDSITATEAKRRTQDLYVGCYSGKVYCVGSRGRTTLIYDAHAAVRKIKQSGTYSYVVSHEFCDILDNGTLVNRIPGNFGFDRTIFEADCIVILVAHNLLRLYSPGGIPFGEITFKDNIADTFIHDGLLRVVTGQKTYRFALKLPSDFKALGLDDLHLPI